MGTAYRVTSNHEMSLFPMMIVSGITRPKAAACWIGFVGGARGLERALRSEMPWELESDR